MEALVEVDHQADFVADGVADRRDGRQIVGEPFPPEPELEGREAAFVAELERLFGRRRRVDQP